MKYGKVSPSLQIDIWTELTQLLFLSQEYADLLKDSRIPQEWKESAIEYRQVRESFACERVTADLTIFLFPYI